MSVNPYNPPKAEATGADLSIDGLSGGEYQFKVPDPKWLFRAFIAFAVLETVALIVEFLNATMLLADNTWIDFGENTYAPFWIIYAAASFGMLPVFIAIIVLYGAWVRPANRNARAFGMQGLQFTPGWCLGWFFFPIGNLFQPYRAVRELNQSASEFAQPEDPKSWNKLPTPIVGWWWFFWLAANGFTNLEARVFWDEPATELVARLSSATGVFTSTLWLVAAFLCCQVIRTINKRQLAKKKSLAVVA